MAGTTYAIALGSNRRHGHHGAPAAVLRAAVEAIGDLGTIETLSKIRSTPALGPAGRSFANAALILTTALEPPELLRELKSLEARFGRRRGRRWGARVLDLDILLWSEGMWADGSLTVPHPEMRSRAFVLQPLAEIASDWRDPLTGLSIRHLLFRLGRRRPVDPARPRP